MSELEKIDFAEQSETIKDRVQNYWTKRAESFYELRKGELESNKYHRWENEINSFIGDKKNLKILDVGCGTGFFEVILGKAGHKVTGIDLTEEMIINANEIIATYGLNDTCEALQIDAEKLAFPDETFDVVISRNLTWTLPHPITAYKEWHRVLKNGGILLNFDAEYAKHAHTNLYSPENKAHSNISRELKDDCHEIYHMLTISTMDRPQWDVEVLKQIGFDAIETDLNFGDRIFKEHDEFYIPDKIFNLKAIR